MAWPMPTVGQWPTGMTVAPDGNMGNITAEQWAAMQQQWQWAQWQQQYASWQSQYGSKYAEQMQAMQSMGVMPPLPPSNAAPPPAPPPPDKPPPPPNENNQPLYGQTQLQPTPVMAPGANNAPSNNIDISTGNNQNRSYATDSSVNSEALKTLAEEEKAFDIQFEKWEEEIENWKKANMNHPDKKAYEEYEQRFEACRARLLERRQQMKQKRAKLLGNTQQNSNVPRHNISIIVPPPVNNTTSSNYNMKKENFNDSFPPPNSNKNMSQIPPIANASQTDYRREYSKIFDPQDRYESYSNTSDMIPNNNLVSTEPFLQPSAPSKGIPGLDLVVEGDRFGKKGPEIVDITGESTAELPSNERPAKQEPDYSKISKGINNILGDEKIMNILSMVRGQIQPSNNAQNAYGSEVGNNSNNYWDRDENKNDNYGMSSNTPYVNQQNDYSAQQDNSQSSNFATVPPRNFNNRPNNTPQGQYYDRNQQYNNSQAMPSRPMPPPSMQPPSMQPGSMQSQSMQSRPMQSGQMPQGPIQSGTMPLGSNMPRQMQQNVSPSMPMRSLLDPLPQNDFNSRGMDRRPLQEVPPNGGVAQNMPVRPHPPARPSWMNEPLFTPSIIVEYEHKPLRLKARDFIEPVHTFDYNHQSKDSDSKKVDFEKEADELFSRHPRAFEKEDRYPERHRDLYYRDLERNSNRDHLRDFRDDQHFKGPIREEYDDRRRYDDDIRDKRYDDRRRDDRDKYTRREDMGHRERDRERDDMFRDRDRERELERIRDRERERERDLERIRERERDLDRIRERDRDMYRDRDRHRDYRRSRSRERESRKRGHSRDSERSNVSASKRSKEGSTTSRLNDKPKHTVMIDDILEPPGRHMRPEKIVIILRGLPGSGKSYLAKLIREREAEQGGTVRVMSIDDYFMQEGEIEEKDPTTGKIVKKPSLKYEYDEKQEETYLNSLKRAFKRSLTDGYFTFLIYDAVNDQLRSYADIWNFARQNGFQVYICTMELDPSTCFKRNIHGRRLEDIEVISARFFPTPDHHIQLDPTTLLQSASITEVQMEDVEDYVQMEDAQETEVDKSFTSKWEKMEDAAQLARLDGIAKPLRPSQLSMEDYLQLDDWKPNISKPGKKTVRWADIEERRQQEKMRAIGFVVGQTDWNRMTDPTMGSSALTQTKYIERVRRN